MKLNQASGLLLHPTSFPAPYGIGELGGEAFRFIDFLAQSGQKLWQILPLNPPGYGESPYQALSAFAGYPLLISLEGLLEMGLLKKEDLQPLPGFPADQVDYAGAISYKYRLFRQAFLRFKKTRLIQEYEEFVQKNSFWLADFSLFASLHEYFFQEAWNRWEKRIAFREKEALLYYENLLGEEIEFQNFLQFIFARQWQEIKEYAQAKGISIIGDLPIFISYHSADTWVNPQLFALDEAGYPAKVAGVPPDYFSSTGQLWGNPHYRWDEMEKNDYFWWRQRLQLMLEMVDYVRVDHFRGFEAYWEVPGDEETAIKGRWVKGPGRKFFSTLEKYFGKLPLIAEDLGYITPEVAELKDEFNYPGMKVLQFTYAEDTNCHHHNPHTIYYSGTHDNDTLLGWYKSFVLSGTRLELDHKKAAKKCWEFIKVILDSPCVWTVFPLQDILGLDSWARMNIPGTVGGNNWRWRYHQGSLTGDLAEKLADLTRKSGR